MLKVIILLCTVISVGAVASEKPHFNVGVEDINYYPIMDFTSPTPKGLLYDILAEFGDTHDISFEFIPLPLLRFTHWFEESSIDFRLPDNSLWSSVTTPSLQYSEAVISLCETTVVLSENSEMLSEDVTRLGLLKGFTPSTQWRKRKEAGTISLAKERTIRSLTRMLLSGLIDAIDLNVAAVKNELVSLGLSPDLVTVAKNIPIGAVEYRMSTQNTSYVIDSLNQYLVNNADAISKKANQYGIASGKSCNVLGK